MMGAAHAYVPRFDAEAVMATIEAHGVTNTVMTPSINVYQAISSVLGC